MDNYRIEFGSFDELGRLDSFTEFSIADQLLEARNVFRGMATNPIDSLSEQSDRKDYYSILKHNNDKISRVKALNFREYRDAVSVVVVFSENYKMMHLQ